MMVLLLVGGGAAVAQVSHDTGVAVSTKADAHGPRGYETLYLSSATSRNDAYDIVTDLRNMLPWAKIYYVPQQNAISLYASAEDMTLAKEILAGVDRPVKSYRLTYTLTETGGGHAQETRHVVMLVAAGEQAEVKQGTRVPVVTASSDPGGKTQASEVQYVDVGLRIRANLSGGQHHLQLHSVVEQTQTAEARANAGTQDPVIEQTSLDGTTTLAKGKPVALGALDIPANSPGGEKRHMTVEVTVEPAG
jgi:type II secretory pathway component GspD/PulD (secretin)